MPYPGEHAARLKDPANYDRFTRTNDKFGPGIHAIWGIKGDGPAELQAIRFDSSKFTIEEAKKWLADHNYEPIEFEPASDEPAARRGFDMKSQGATAEILIYGDIGCGPWNESGVDAKTFAEELNKLNGVNNITVRLNSPGGYVSHGIAIYNSLKQHKAKITVQIDAMAISIATIIAMAGDTVTMAANGLFMIHDPSTICIGTSEDMRKEADVMDKMKTLMVETYAKRSKLNPDELSAAMKAETWYTAAEAMAAGFVDSITPASGATAHLDPQKYHYRNAPVIVAHKDPEIPARIISLENYRRKLELAEYA